jgi:hypothetical protein
MPVQLNLNTDQREVFENALKKKTIPNLNLQSRFLNITADNIVPIYEAIESLHMKNFKIKTKNITHLHNCYNAEQIMLKLNALLPEFPGVSFAANDAEIGIVEAVQDETDIPVIQGAADSERLSTLATEGSMVTLETDEREVNLNLNTKIPEEGDDYKGADAD